MPPRKKRQKPKRAWHRRKRNQWPVGGTPPLRKPHETVTETTTYMSTPGVAGYPLQDEQHAVTTNQEPRYSWPPVDLPELTGFTVHEAPSDNGQANPQTIYDPAAVETSPYNDYSMGNAAGGSGDIYPQTENARQEPDYPPNATDVQGDEYA